MSDGWQRVVEQRIAAEIRCDPDDVTFSRFEARPGRQWSEITTEDFSCSVIYVAHDEECAVEWGESDVCDFLNGVR